MLRSPMIIDANGLPRRGPIVTALGLIQIISWGSSYYLPAVLAKPISVDTGWTLPWVVGGLSLGLLVSGMASPRVGHTIEHYGGRLVLSCGSILFAIGFVFLSLSTNIVTYLTAWLIIGLAMGCGLYDATFATLGGIYGQAARPVITTLTLFGGLSSTVCWPLTAFLDAELGWRVTCLVYAGLHLGICLPLNLFMLPCGNPVPHTYKNHENPAMITDSLEEVSSGRRKTIQIALLTLIFTLNSGLVTVIFVHLISILQTRGMELSSAVALGAMIGPSQVASRLLELIFGRYYHPLWTMSVSVTLVAGSLILMGNQAQITAATIIFFGFGVGLSSIMRGTVPLRLFGAFGYASLMGRLAILPLISQAIFPSLASFLILNNDASGIVTIVTGIALVNIFLTGILWLTKKSNSNNTLVRPI